MHHLSPRLVLLGGCALAFGASVVQVDGRHVLYLYRHGRVSGTREMVVHPNYIVVYRVTHVVEILNVLHSRQEYP